MLTMDDKGWRGVRLTMADKGEGSNGNVDIG